MYQRILLPTDGAEFIHSETIKLADEKLATIEKFAQAAGRFSVASVRVRTNAVSHQVTVGSWRSLVRRNWHRAEEFGSATTSAAIRGYTCRAFGPARSAGTGLKVPPRGLTTNSGVSCRSNYGWHLVRISFERAELLPRALVAS